MGKAKFLGWGAYTTCGLGWSYRTRFFVFDLDKAKEAVKKLSNEKIKELIERIEAFREWKDYHTRMCNTYDCQVVRAREGALFEIGILRELGVKVEEVVVDTCWEDWKKLEEELDKLPDVVPSELVYDEAEKRGLLDP